MWTAIQEGGWPNSECEGEPTEQVGIFHNVYMGALTIICALLEFKVCSVTAVAPSHNLKSVLVPEPSARPALPMKSLFSVHEDTRQRKRRSSRSLRGHFADKRKASETRGALQRGPIKNSSAPPLHSLTFRSNLAEVFGVFNFCPQLPSAILGRVRGGSNANRSYQRLSNVEAVLDKVTE